MQFSRVYLFEEDECKKSIKSLTFKRWLWMQVLADCWRSLIDKEENRFAKEEQWYIILNKWSFINTINIRILSLISYQIIRFYAKNYGIMKVSKYISLNLGLILAVW